MTRRVVTFDACALRLQKSHPCFRWSTVIALLVIIAGVLIILKTCLDCPGLAHSFFCCGHEPDSHNPVYKLDIVYRVRLTKCYVEECCHFLQDSQEEDREEDDEEDSEDIESQSEGDQDHFSRSIGLDNHECREETVIQRW